MPYPREGLIGVNTQEAVYYQQLTASEDEFDEDFWRDPYSVEVEGDSLKFLYIPDSVEHRIVGKLAEALLEIQANRIGMGDGITHALMVTMGGLLPGVFLHDQIAWRDGLGIEEFGIIGVQLYKGPGERFDQPLIKHDTDMDVADKVVLVVEDLGDTGGTPEFIVNLLKERGAREVLLALMYMKPKAKEVLSEVTVLYFGDTPQDTWIIMPRERVETLRKRVPYWRDQGLDREQCEANLVKIGYPKWMIKENLPDFF